MSEEPTPGALLQSMPAGLACRSMWPWLQAHLSRIPLDAVEKAVPVIVALGGLYVWRQKSKDSKLEFIRARAERVKGMIDEIINDKEAGQALLMIEPEARLYQIHGHERRLYHEQAMEALMTNVPDDDQIYIRDCFDKLFYLLDRVEKQMVGGLVRFEDLETPLTYYARLMAGDSWIYRSYLHRTGYGDLDGFFMRLGDWPPFL